MKIPQEYFDEIKASIRVAINEDIGSGDVTGDLILPSDAPGQGRLFAKAEGVIAGLGVIEEVFRQVDRQVRIEFFLEDGQIVKPGDLIAVISGSQKSILKGERTALNYLQRMSGIATRTSQYVDLIKHTECVLLDTRKTAPGLRAVDKWSVSLGGGSNHRRGLYDMILIKENHIAAAGGIVQAVSKARSGNVENLKIEVEVQDLQELQEALDLNVDRIMLDNMSIETMRQAVKMTADKIPLEASGGITSTTIKKIAETGVNFISIGELTHSAVALDISLILEKN